MGLALDANDSITKPFSLRESQSRINAVLRCTTGESARIYRFGDCESDFDRGGALPDLTALVFRLLSTFIRRRGRVRNRRQVADAARDEIA